MKFIRNFLAITAFTSIGVLSVSCGGNSSGGGGSKLSSSDIINIATTAAVVAGEDEDQARRYGEAAGELAGLASDVSPEQELALGEALALRSFEQVGPRLEDEQMQKYVNLVALGVARQSSRPDLKFSVTILDSEVPNAFAAPAGFIFITTGALELMETESELAGVLGHEISHITERHMIKTLKRNRLFSAASATIEAVDEEKAEYAQRINTGQDLLFNRGLDQNLEYEADVVGTELAILTGYDPNGLTSFLEKLANVTDKQEGVFKTHPDSYSRASKLRRLTTTQFSGISGAKLEDRFYQNVTSRL